MYFPAKWGVKQPQNPQKHRVGQVYRMSTLYGFLDGGVSQVRKSTNREWHGVDTSRDIQDPPSEDQCLEPLKAEPQEMFFLGFKHQSSRSVFGCLDVDIGHFLPRKMLMDLVRCLPCVCCGCRPWNSTPPPGCLTRQRWGWANIRRSEVSNTP